MSSTELDLPVLVTPEQIRRREFVTTRRGYDVEQVRDYLDQLAGQVGQMESMLRSVMLQAGAAERAETGPRADPYERLAERVADVLRTTDREADRIRREAKDDAERILRDARADADRVRLDAQAKAEQSREEADRALREAKSRADRTITGLANRRDALVEQLAAMQERLVGVAQELEAAIERPDDVAAEVAAEMQSGVEDAPALDQEADGGPEHSTPSAEPGPSAPVDTTTRLIDLGAPPPTVEELWESADPHDLQIPEIPPLELDWHDAEDDDRPD